MFETGTLERGDSVDFESAPRTVSATRMTSSA